MGKSKKASLDNFVHNNNFGRESVKPICDHGASTGQYMRCMQHIPGRYFWAYDRDRFGRLQQGFGEPYAIRGVCNCGMLANNIDIMWEMYDHYGTINTNFVNCNETITVPFDTSTVPSPPPPLLKWECDPANNYYGHTHNPEAQVQPFNKTFTRSRRQPRIIFPENN